MNQLIPNELYPVMVLQDRYGGVYSGGQWIAVREADELIDGRTRAAFVVEEGPSGCDLTASMFWSEPPAWTATGATPEAAILALLSKGGDRDDLRGSVRADHRL